MDRSLFITKENAGGLNAGNISFFAHSSPEIPSSNNIEHMDKQAAIGRLRASRAGLGISTNNFGHVGGFYVGGSSNDLDYLRKK